MADFERCPDWVRPCEWPDLPAIGEDEEKIVGLVEINDTDSEFLAVLCEGDYIVDWGDGTPPELVSGGVKAEHRYVFADVPGDPICPSDVSSDYAGYKTVVVEITPQPGDSTSSSFWPALTKVDFQQRHSDVGTNPHLAKWLEIDMNVPSCTSLTLGSDPTIIVGYEVLSSPVTLVGWLQSVTLRKNSLTSFYALFSNCFGLQRVDIQESSAVTTTSHMFWCCSSIKKVALFDTSAVTTMLSMFNGCNSLACIPLFDTSLVTTMESMFYECWNVREIPFFDTANVATLRQTFFRCGTLRTIPALNTSNVTSLYETFRDCACLRELPLLDTSKVTSMYFTFSNCALLLTLPAFDTSSVTTMQGAFDRTYLSIIPALDMSAVTVATSMFSAAHLVRSHAYGLRYSHRYDQTTRGLTPVALNEIFTNLGTAAGARSINITGCLGATTCDKTIATAKGWTVIG